MPQIIKESKKTKNPKKTVVKKTQLVPLTRTKKTSSRSRTKHSPTDYYQCLMNYAQQGFYDSSQKLKIHSCCKKCKLSAPALNNQRDKELVKLITSYKQVGDSLKRLLEPLQ